MSDDTNLEEARAGAGDDADTGSSPDSSADDASSGEERADDARPGETDRPSVSTSAAPSVSGGSGAPAAEAARLNNRKVREGLVVSNGMERTAVVRTIDRVRHRRYNKTVRRHKHLYVHDPDNDLNVGDRVRVQETRPISKTKRWRVLQVLERAR